MNYLTIVIVRAIVRVVARIVAAFIHAIKGDQAQAMCNHCAHAHITIGHLPGQRATACTYGGVTRALKFVVSDCSTFNHQNARLELVRIVGFAENQTNRSNSRTARRLTD